MILVWLMIYMIGWLFTIPDRILAWIEETFLYCRKNVL
jgi:hypothetical protein